MALSGDAMRSSDAADAADAGGGERQGEEEEAATKGFLLGVGGVGDVSVLSFIQI